MRGVIENRDRRKQIVDFSGMRYGKITPTDIDGVIEYRNRAFIYIELKHRDAPLPRGQELYIERQVDVCRAGGKQAVAIVAEHGVDDTERDVDAASCKVRKIYYDGEWFDDGLTRSLREVVDSFISFACQSPFESCYNSHSD